MEKQPDIRIFIACHKPTYVRKIQFFYPVQVGTALTEKRLEHMAYRDNEGDNISGKNPDYCELTAQYWAWKNIDCDYYGFFHYRRYLTFHRVCPVMASGRILGKRQHPYIELDSVWDDLTPVLDGSRVDGAADREIRSFDRLPGADNTTVYRQYCQYHEAEELNHMLEIVNRVYPEYTDSAKAYMSSKDIYYMNMYIMKKRAVPYLYGMAFYTFRYIRAGEKRDKQTAGTKAVWLSCGAVVWYLLLLPEEERHTMCRASLS